MTRPSTSAPSAHPSHSPIVSRRSILSGIPLLAAVAAGAAPAMAQPAPDAAFARLVDACREARDCKQAYDRDVFSPAHDAWSAAVDTVPHYTTKSSFSISSSGSRYQMSTERALDVRIVEDRLGAPRSSIDDDFTACCDEMAMALQQRKDRVRELKRQYRIAELEAEYDRLSVLWYEAVDAVEEHPVRSVEDLLTKMQLLAEDDDRQRSASDMIPELRRILGREA